MRGDFRERHGPLRFVYTRSQASVPSCFIVAVLNDLKEAAPDVVAHGGDLASSGAHPAELIDRIRDLDRPGDPG